MDTSKQTPLRLFAASIRYVVPLFQRGYVWTQEYQWEPLWDDIRDTARRYRQTGIEFPHFLGAIVLKQLRVQPGQPPAYLVVDGQQRLTTLQLALAGIRDALTADATRDTPHSDPLFQIQQLTRNPLPPGQSGQFESKIVPFDDTDIRAFDAVMAARRPPDASHPMVKCHDYFRIQSASILGQDESPADIRDFIHAACNLLRIVSITLGERESEHLIFETLNARAEPLSEWEKARNLFLAEASETYDKSGETIFYNKYLRPLDRDSWWTKKVYAHGDWVDRSGVLLRFWLVVEDRRMIPPHRVYYWFRRVVRERKQSGGTIADIATSFARSASLFREIEDPGKPQSVGGRFFHRRGVFGLGVVVPLLMKIYDLLEVGTARDRCIIALESWVIRRFLMGWNFMGYDKFFLSLIQRLSSLESQGPDGVVASLIEGLREPKTWPSDSEVRHAVVSRRVYPGHAQKRVLMMLSTLEDHLIESDGLASYPKALGRLWIEHVMPLAWREHWPLAETGATTEEERDRALVTLGNLTLTGAKLNNLMSNGPWTTKREDLRRHDNLFLNKDLLSHATDDEWNEAAIQARGLRMAKHICEIWPHADAL